MKKALSVGIVLSLFLMFSPIDVRAQQQTGSTPPLAQPLVREGDFAVKLAEGLKVGMAQSEAEAESTLTSVGIAPRNGWIADYPVTPDIIGELRNAVGEAADSGRLSMRREEAERALDILSANVGLSVVPETRREFAQNEPSPSNQPPPSETPPSGEPAPYYGEYSNPEVINNYYYDSGPPVVTYYPPPWDYYYMYAWVPYPFWCSGFFFPGYFILNDFSRFIVVGGNVVVVSNHYHDHWSRRIHRIDPVTRRTWKDLGWDEGSSHWKRGNTAEAREAASSIYRRSLDRRSSSQPPTEGRDRRFGGRDFANPRPGERSAGPGTGDRYERRVPPRTGNNPPALNERREWPGRPPAADRSSRRTGPEVAPRERDRSSFNPPASGNRERFASPSPAPSNRSHDSGRSSSGSRSYSPPVQGEARSPITRGGGSFSGSRGGGGRQGGSGHGATPKSGICMSGRC